MITEEQVQEATLLWHLLSGRDLACTVPRCLAQLLMCQENKKTVIKKKTGRE
jgi:hypothetical protein